MTAVLLSVPATASAADNVSVHFGVLRDWSDTQQVDRISVRDGAPALPDRIVVRDAATPEASPGPGCRAETPDGVSCDAGLIRSLNVVTGDLDDTIAVDVALPSWLDAGPGADRVDGGPGADTVFGGDGPDVLDGRLGADRIYGGSGDDVIEARDGLADTIDCGEGDDRATIDEGLDEVVGCEVAPPAAVDVPGAQDPAPLVPEADATVAQGDIVDDERDATETGAPAPVVGEPLVRLPLAVPQAIALASAVAKVSSDGRAALEMACAKTEVAGCRGDVFLDPAPKAAGKAKASGETARARMSRRGRYGRSPFVIAAGRKAKLQVKLTPEARRALGLPSGKKARASRRGRRVRARVTVVPKGRAATRSVVELRS